MREILFRAKRKNWRELPKEDWWVEGYLFDDGMCNTKHYFIGVIVVEPYKGTACDEWNITGYDFCEVDPETICQYTRLKDKDGNRIWENDIVSGDRLNIGIRKKYLIKYSEEESCLKIKEFKYGQEYYVCKITLERFERIESIFDNPELLEEYE